MTTANFRVSTDILRRLGEELITSFDQGIVELAKNSYDADALMCTVELRDTDEPGGTVIVADDGDGMSLDDILDGWFILGRSLKNPGMRTALHRLPAGSKGLGRLGALRLGRDVVLVTRPRAEANVEYVVHICWPEFDRHNVIEDVEIDIKRQHSAGGTGTRIEISGLKSTVRKAEVERLARELILLSDPFGDPSGFTAELVAPEFKEFESLVRVQYFEDCEFRLVANLDQRGVASAKVLDRSGSIRWSSAKGDFFDHYYAPAATFELWAFLLQRSSFEGRTSSLPEVRNWLNKLGGVHLYHRALRVRPYGDQGHDWLEMNLSRSRDPELRPSTNTSMGRMKVIDEEEELLQKTDRMGFVENTAFNHLKQFGIDALEWMHKERLAVRETQKHTRKLETNERIVQAEANLSRAISSLPAPDRRDVGKAARELSSVRSVESRDLRDELALYQTLASVGTTVSVFAHEIEGPASDLIVSSQAVKRRAQGALGSEYKRTLGSQIESVIHSAELLARFATLPLGLLKRSKRRRTTLDVNKTVSETVALFEPYLVDARVEAICELSLEQGEVRGSVAAIESILSNLITNSVKAFKREGIRITERKLLVRTSVTSEHVLMGVLDSGPGIPKRLGDRIWLPGVTSDENGTGLGLTIVRDTVRELGGTANAVSNCELGGTEFVIQLPRSKS
jgi:signal transduction histidine kinase